MIYFLYFLSSFSNSYLNVGASWISSLAILYFLSDIPFFCSFVVHFYMFPQFASSYPFIKYFISLVIFLRLFLILFLCAVFASIFKNVISCHVFGNITISSLFEIFISLKSICVLQSFMSCLGMCNGLFIFSSGTLKTDKQKKWRLCAYGWSLSFMEFISGSSDWAIHWDICEVGLVTCLRERGGFTLQLAEKDLTAFISGSQQEKRTGAVNIYLFPHLRIVLCHSIGFGLFNPEILPFALFSE